MTCDDCREDMVFYAGHQLPPSEEAEIAGHLETCAACRRELEEEVQFARSIHNASVPFRQTLQRSGRRVAAGSRTGDAFTRRLADVFRRAGRPAWVLVSGLALTLAFLLVTFVRKPEGEPDSMTRWAIGHFPLIDQTHPLRGDAATVRSWFKEHHGLDVTPPQGVDYTALAGCKMADIDSKPAPLLRFEGKDTSAVFMLPAGVAGSHDALGHRVFRSGAYSIEMWSESGNAYIKITKGGTGGT